MRYIELDKRLIMNIANLENIVNNIFSYGYISQENVMMALFSEMVSCGCLSASDKKLPKVNVIEIRLMSQDTIGIKSKYQKTRLKRMGKE